MIHHLLFLVICFLCVSTALFYCKTVLRSSFDEFMKIVPQKFIGFVVIHVSLSMYLTLKSEIEFSDDTIRLLMYVHSSCEHERTFQLNLFVLSFLTHGQMV